MKKFALPQQKETSVNNLTKTSELFDKYKLTKIGSTFEPDDSLTNRVKQILNQFPNTYNDNVRLILFLYDFVDYIPDELATKIRNILSDKIDFFKYYQQDPIKQKEDYVLLDKSRIVNLDDESINFSKQYFDWNEAISLFIKKNFGINVKSTPVPAPVPSIWHPEFLDRVEAVVKGGLSYFDTFLSGLAPMLGDKQSYHLYKYQYKIIDRNVTSLDEFVRKNSHLGRHFFVEVMPLLMSEEQIRLREKAKVEVKQEEMNEELIGDDSNIFPTLKIPKLVEDEAYLLELVNNNFVRASSTTQGVDHDYVYGVLDEATFWGIGEPAVMGAIKDARDEINALPGCESFTLKELMMSPVVATKFQLYVSYLMQRGSGGYAYAGRAYVSKLGKVNGTTFNVSAGTKQRNVLALNMEGCQYWFQDVKKIKNPRIQELETFIREAAEERKSLLTVIGLDPDQQNAELAWLNKLAIENPENFVLVPPRQNAAGRRNPNPSAEVVKLRLKYMCENMKLSRLLIGKNEKQISIENAENGNVFLLQLTDSQLNYLDLSIHWRIATNQLKFMPKNILVHYE